MHFTTLNHHISIVFLFFVFASFVQLKTVVQKTPLTIKLTPNDTSSNDSRTFECTIANLNRQEPLSDPYHLWFMHNGNKIADYTLNMTALNGNNLFLK